MYMEITRDNVEAAIAIFDILAKKKCTVTDACQILGFVSRKLGKAATVPELDYSSFLKEEMEAVLDMEQQGE